METSRLRTRSILRTDRGFYIGVRLWALLEPLCSVGSMSFALARNVD